MIKLQNVDFKYKNSDYVLKNVNLDINEGECISIIGKNGAGKSSITKLIAGITKPTHGSILVDEIDTKNKKDFYRLRKKVGIVFQNPDNQILFNNVYDDIAFGLKNLNLEDIDLRINEALKKVKMHEYINKETYELSLGQKQRITIASVLAVNPKYVVLDEPTTMIDSSGKQEIYEIIKNLKESGYTVIYTTNSIDEILLADRIIIIDGNEISQEFAKKDILENIDTLKKYNIKVPEIVQALQKLKNNGININLKDWTISELTDKIIEELKK